LIVRWYPYVFIIERNLNGERHRRDGSMERFTPKLAHPSLCGDRRSIFDPIALLTLASPLA